MDGSDKIKNTYFPDVNLLGFKGTGYLYANQVNDGKNITNYRSAYELPRVVIDTEWYREAIKEAERPLPSLPARVKMQQMFMDTIQNSYVFSCMEKRMNLTLLKKFHFVDEQGNENEAATELINKKWFQDMRRYILEAQFYGYSLISFGDMVNGDFTNVEIARRGFVSPDRLILSQMPYVPSGIPFMNPAATDENGISYYDWSLYIPTNSENGISKCGYGLLYKVAYYEILIRSITKWNADFLQMFGQPLRVASTTQSGDVRAELERALAQMGSVPYIIKDPQDEIEFIEAKSTGTGYKSYDNAIERIKKNISMIILGHEDAISSTPGRLGASQKQGAEDSPVSQALRAVESLDSHFEEFVVNDLLIPKLLKLGVKIPIGLKYQLLNDTEQQEADKHEMDYNLSVAQLGVAMTQAGLKMPVEYFEEMTGIENIEVVQIAKSSADNEESDLSSEVQSKLKDIYSHTTNGREKIIK